MSTTKTSTMLSADLAAKINDEFAAIKKAEIDGDRSVVSRAIAFGAMLKQTKEQVGHGKWINWLHDNCRQISERMAQRYMNLADSQAVRNELGKNDTRVVYQQKAKGWGVGD